MNEITSQEILERISRHCPSALSAYLNCINRANPEGKFFFSRNLIEEEMSESFTKFKNNLKALAKENLLEWHTKGDGLMVILADLYDEE